MKLQLLVLSFCISVPATLFAQSANNEAIELMQTTAKSICGGFSSKGFKKELVVKGGINAELKGLAKKLADIGIEGAADFNSSEYSNVLHDQLGAELTSIRDCNLLIWSDLKGLIIDTLPPPQNVLAKWQNQYPALTRDYVKCSCLSSSGLPAEINPDGPNYVNLTNGCINSAIVVVAKPAASSSSTNDGNQYALIKLKPGQSALIDATHPGGSAIGLKGGGVLQCG